jgi:hypothetical protein
MDPLDDTLQHAETRSRAEPPVPESGSSSSGLSDDFDLQQTLRQQAGEGQYVFNRYRLNRVLGRGGMGIVWLATDTKLDRQVALKFLPDLIGSDPVALRELKEETKRGLELAHPHIVRFYDFVDDGESAAISMEYIDGSTLAEKRLECAHQVFPTAELSPWILQVTDALDYAHVQRRIVHRDLKPANLMLDREAGIKVADFGIARSLSDTMSRVSVRGNTSGTLLYMSPQQAMGERPRPTDDIYSLGATLYELLAGKPPFYTGDVSRQITTRTAPRIKDRREELEIAASEDIPEQWESVIADCLQKDPACRPQTAGEVAERLGLRPAKTSSARPTTKSSTLQELSPAVQAKPKEKARDSARAPWPMWAGVGVLTVLFVMGGWWWMHRPATWEIIVEPQGALITIDGKTLVSPAVFSGLDAGAYTATIVAEGYEPHNLSVELKAGQSAMVPAVALVRSTGKLELDTKPTGASYRIESTSGSAEPLKGKTPDTLNLPVGEYVATLEYQGSVRETTFVIRRNDMSKQAIVIPQALPEPQPAVGAVPPERAPLTAVADRPPEASAPQSAPPSQAMPPGPPATTSIEGSLAGSTPPPAPPPPAPVTPPATESAGLPPAPAGAAPVAAIAGAGAAPPGPSPQEMATLLAAGPPPPAAMLQSMSKTTPEQGYWALEDMLSGTSYSSYSERGRGYVLYKAQQKLKEMSYYTSSLDGKPGKGTHKAIQDFQAAHFLPQSGLLDSATLTALELNGLEDNSAWGKSSSGSTRRSNSGSSNRTPESEKTKFRRGFERMIGRDLNDVFKRP